MSRVTGPSPSNVRCIVSHVTRPPSGCDTLNCMFNFWGPPARYRLQFPILMFQDVSEVFRRPCTNKRTVIGQIRPCLLAFERHTKIVPAANTPVIFSNQRTSHIDTNHKYFGSIYVQMSVSHGPSILPLWLVIRRMSHVTAVSSARPVRFICVTVTGPSGTVEKVQ